jgi:DeoR/GlpR family transcriptional regulator of sugar metabolism
VLGVTHTTIRRDVEQDVPESGTSRSTGSPALKLIEGGMSLRQAAKVLGVDEKTIRKDMRTESAESADQVRTGSPEENDAPLTELEQAHKREVSHGGTESGPQRDTRTGSPATRARRAAVAARASAEGAR